MKEELVGLNVGLLLRVIGYMVILPLMALYYISQDPTGAVIVLELTIAGYFFYTGWLLRKLDKKGVKLAKIGEAASIVIGVLLLFVAPGMGIRAIVGGTIWLLYFYKSKRVKNTYFPQPTLDTQATVSA